MATEGTGAAAGSAVRGAPMGLLYTAPHRAATRPLLGAGAWTGAGGVVVSLGSARTHTHARARACLTACNSEG